MILRLPAAFGLFLLALFCRPVPFIKYIPYSLLGQFALADRLIAFGCAF